MSKVIPFKSSQENRVQLQEQACAWLARLDAEPDEGTREALAQWLAEDPQHYQVLMEMAVLWDEISVLDELAHLFPLEAYPPATKPSRLRALLPLAASCLLVLGVLALARNLWLGPQPALPESVRGMAMQQLFETDIGEQLTQELSDGSRVILNTDSRLRVVYMAAARHVFLERGEAYFSVAKQPQRPFRVFAGSRVIEATGTAFTVQRLDEVRVEVVVTEGSVDVGHLAPELSAPGQILPGRPLRETALMSSAPLNLQAGDHVTAALDQADNVLQRRMQPDEIEVRLSWRHGMLLFQGEPLEQVLEEVGRYTTIRLEADESVRQIPVQGYFRAGDVEGLLFAMRENFQLKVDALDDAHFRLSQ